MPGVDYPCASRRQLGRLAELNAAHAAAPKGRGAQRRVIYGVEATPSVSARCASMFTDDAHGRGTVGFAFRSGGSRRAEIRAAVFHRDTAPRAPPPPTPRS